MGLPAFCNVATLSDNNTYRPRCGAFSAALRGCLGYCGSAVYWALSLREKTFICWVTQSQNLAEMPQQI